MNEIIHSSPIFQQLWKINYFFPVLYPLAQIEAEFSWIAGLKADVNGKLPELEDFTELSIGMSDDWRIALGFGATIVRIGTAIFGPREY